MIFIFYLLSIIYIIVKLTRDYKYKKTNTSLNTISFYERILFIIYIKLLIILLLNLFNSTYLLILSQIFFAKEK